MLEKRKQTNNLSQLKWFNIGLTEKNEPVYMLGYFVGKAHRPKSPVAIYINKLENVDWDV